MSFKAVTFTVLLVTAAGSITARALMEDEPVSAASPPGAVSTGLVPDADRTPPSDGEDDGLAIALPYVTEASFFAIIGFALGYASKKVLKIGLIVLALLFVAVQVLSWQGILTIDWQRAVDVVNDLILDINENDTVGEVIKNRLPGAGGLVVGYALGFRKG